MTDEEVKMNGTQFEGKEVYVKDVFTEIAGYYDEITVLPSFSDACHFDHSFVWFDTKDTVK